MSERIRAAIESAFGYLTEHPDEARYTDSFATAKLEDGLRMTVHGPDGAAMVTDMPASVGGAASAPSPGWFLRAAEASCTATLIAMRAAHLGVPVESIEVTVDSQSDDRGILGIDEVTPAGPLSTLVRARIASPASSREELQSLFEWAVDHCPVTDAVRRAVPIAVELAE